MLYTEAAGAANTVCIMLQVLQLPFVRRQDEFDATLGASFAVRLQFLASLEHYGAQKAPHESEFERQTIRG